MSDLPRLVELCLIHRPEAFYQPLHLRLVSRRPVKARTEVPHLARVNHISDPIRPVSRCRPRGSRTGVSLTSVHLAGFIELFLEVTQDLLRRTCNIPTQRDVHACLPDTGPARRLRACPLAPPRPRPLTSPMPPLERPVALELDPDADPEFAFGNLGALARFLTCTETCVSV